MTQPLCFGQIGLASPQHLLSPLAIGDVPHEAQVVGPTPVFEIVRADLDREDAAVSSAVAALEGQRSLRLKGAPMVSPTLRRKVRVNIRHGHAEQIIATVTQDAAGVLVDVLKPPLIVY